MKLFFFCHVIHHFGLVFEGELIENDFQIPQGHVGHHHLRRHQGQGGVHQVVDEIILWSFYHFGLIS